jgi:hypothetical protein
VGSNHTFGLLSLKGNDWSTIYLVEHEATNCAWHTLAINKLGKRVVKITAAKIGSMSEVSDVILGCGSALIVGSLISVERSTLLAIVIPLEASVNNAIVGATFHRFQFDGLGILRLEVLLVLLRGKVRSA